MADHCGRELAEALMHAVEDKRTREAERMRSETRPKGHNGVEYTT